MRFILYTLVLAYAFMAGTIYAHRGAEAWAQCVRLEDTDFTAYLTNFKQ